MFRRNKNASLNPHLVKALPLPIYHLTDYTAHLQHNAVYGHDDGDGLDVAFESGTLVFQCVTLKLQQWWPKSDGR